jgi:hypothetical protein
MDTVKEQKTIENIEDFEPGEENEPLLENIIGMIRTVSTAPTYTPTKFSQQLVNYDDGTNKRLYIYDRVNKSWSYITKT